MSCQISGFSIPLRTGRREAKKERRQGTQRMDLQRGLIGMLQHTKGAAKHGSWR